MSTAQSSTGRTTGGAAVPATTASATTGTVSGATTAPLVGRAVRPERSIGQLLADASKDLSSILRSEVALAKVELKTEVAQGVRGAVFFVVAGGAAFLGGLMLLFAVAYGLFALGLPRWLAFLVVAVVLFVVAGVAALIGRRQLSKVGPPERTVRTTKETVEALKAASHHA